MARTRCAYTPITRAEPEATEPTPAELVADGVVDLKTAAKMCGHAATWMKDQVRSGAVASFLLGRRRVIPRRALIDFLAAEMSKAAG